MAGAASLHGWLPIRAFFQDGTLMAELCLIGERRFFEPFFEDTLGSCVRSPFNAAFRQRVSIDTLADWQKTNPGLLPSGFIFHMSRCGSTLVSQMLAALTSNRVISEAGPIDAALRAGSDGGKVLDETRIGWLRAMIGMLGQPRSAEEQNYFVKFDSWHTLFLPLILRAFPNVPWLFLYRDPVEVIVSHMRQPGAQMVPGMLGFGPSGAGQAVVAQLPREEYCARMLATISEAAVKAADLKKCLLVNYSDLPNAMWDQILHHFGLKCSEGDLDLMANAARNDAKNSAFEFAPDAEAKQREASELVRRAARQWVLPQYRQLEAIRAQPTSVGGFSSKDREN